MKQIFFRFFRRGRIALRACAAEHRWLSGVLMLVLAGALGWHTAQTALDAVSGYQQCITAEGRPALYTLAGREQVQSDQQAGSETERASVPDFVITEWFGGQAMDRNELRRTIEFVTLHLMPDGSWCSQGVHDLLMETAAVETALGSIVRQHKGPALSVWQILGFNFVEIRDYFAKYNPELLERAMFFYNQDFSEDWNRVYNIPWTASMSLLFYEKATRGTFVDQLGSLESRGRLWKKIYNTRLGKGTVEGYKKRALQYVHLPDSESM